MSAASRYFAPEPSAPRISLQEIPKGYPGTLRTVGQVKRLIRDGVKDFYVRQKAIDILLARRIRPKNYLGEIKALFQWVQRNVRYTRDPFRLEVLHSPRRMLELRAGDCDDMTILLGSLLESIGHPVRLVLTGPDPLRPKLFSHIYLEVNHRGDWIPCDATMPHPMGWAPRTLVKQVIPIEEERNHDIGERGARDSGGPSTRTTVALGTDSRRPAGRTPGERSAGENALGPTPKPGAPGTEPVAQDGVAFHLGQRVDPESPPGSGAAAQGVASAVGDPAASSDGAVVDRGATRDRLRPARPPAPSTPAGPGSAGRMGPSGGAAGPPSLSGYVRHGADLYHRFNRFAPGCLARVVHTRVMPPVVVQLGELVGLIYRSDKWQRGEPRTYIHMMRTPPRLVSDVAGRQLFLVGGSYRVTTEGIEG